MQVVFEVFRALSALAFVGYGSACLTTQHMTAEFERFGLARSRKLVGALELLGGVGLALGYFHRPVLLLSSAGLTLLMFLGVLTRVRIRDSAVETSPAVVLLLMNGYVFWHAKGA